MSGIFYGYIIVAAAAFITAAFAGTRFAFGVFFIPMLTAFNWTRGMTSLAFSLSWIIQGITGIFMGRLNDKVGPRIVLTVCGFLMGLGFILMSQINALWQFYFYYAVIIGAGGSVFVPLTSTVARWFTDKRSMMTGIAIAGGGIGSFITPPIANWLISSYDWRISYLVIGIAIMIISISAAQFLKSNTGGGQKNNSLAKDGFSLKEALSKVQLWISLFIVFCLGFNIYSITVHIVPHAIDLGIAPTTAANILALLGGLSTIGRIAIGNIGDKIGNKRAYIMGLSLLAATLFWLLFANEVWMLFIIAAVLGFGWGVGALISPTVADLFGLISHGTITGIVSFGYCIGGALGPWLTGYLFDITGSYESAFIITVLISILSIILTTLLKPVSSTRASVSIN